MPLATKQQVFQELWNWGFFSGYERILQKYRPDLAEAASFKSHLYGLLLKEVVEAKKESVKLQATLERMEARCRRGVQNPGTPKNGWDEHATPLQNDVVALDGWVMSLLESDITLLHYLQSFETATNRALTIPQSIRTLIEKRRSDQRLFESDSGAFKLKLI